MWSTHFWIFETENLLHTTVLSQPQTVCYSLLYCHKHRQFVTACCIVTNTGSVLQPAVLSQTQTVCYSLLYCHKHRQLQHAVLSQTQTVCYSLLYCHKHRQFVADYNIVTKTDNMLQATVLSQTPAVWYRILYYLRHRQSHSLSYSLYSHLFYSVSCSCVFYFVLMKTGSEITSDMLRFSVDKSGRGFTNMFDDLQTWCSSYFFVFCYKQWYLTVCCVHSTVMNICLLSDCSSSSLQLSAVNWY